MDFDELQKKINSDGFEKDLEKKLMELLTPAITFLVYLWIYLWIHDHYGFDRAVISLLIIIILTLNGISRKIK